MPYLTTDAAAEDHLCRRFTVPANLMPIFMGALTSLTFAENFEAFGDLSPDEMATLFTDILADFRGCHMIGTLVSYITDDPPDGVLPLTGGTYNNVDYPLLAAAWAGTDFNNGDGTFSVPDTRGFALVHIHPSWAGLPNYLTQSVGDSTHVLNWNEMPTHFHEVYNLTHIELPVLAPGEAPVSLVADFPNITEDAGGSEAHNNVQPSFGVNRGVVAK